MKQTLIQLAERREHLIARVAAQRVALADVIEPWRAPLALADQGLFALRFLKRHPVWIVGSVVLLATFRLGGSMKWLRRGWVSWQIARRVLGR